MSVHSTVVWSLLAPIVVVLWLAGVHNPMSLLLSLLFLVLGVPWRVARAVTIPAGLVRTSWVLGRLAEVVWRFDRHGGAALAAAWALARRRRPHLGLTVWVDRRLEALAPLRGAGVLAAGIAAGARGDLADARRLIESMVDLGESPRTARRLAAEWLAADAAARGDWAQVRARAAHDPTPAARLLGLAAQRLQGVPVPSWKLRLAWLLAPRRRATRPLVERALAGQAPAPQAPDASSTAASAPPAGHPYRDGTPPREHRLRDALAAHLSVAPAALGDVAARWDEALADGETRRFVAARAAALGARQPDALATLAATAEEDLVELALVHDQPVDGTGPVAAAVARRLRERLLGDIEQAARSLATRVAAGRALPAIHEWRETLALRDRLSRGARLGGLPLRRLVFEDVHAALCPLACRLWNDRGQRIVADALFRFLLGEAEAVGHTRLAEHERKNVKGL